MKRRQLSHLLIWPLCTGPVQVHAACNGLYGYRASTGAAPLQGVGPVTGALDTLGWAARDPSLLRRVGEALQLPGGAQPP